MDASLQTTQVTRSATQGYGGHMDAPVAVGNPGLDAALYTTQLSRGNNQAYGGNVDAPVAVGNQGLDSVINMLAGSGVFGPATDASAIRPVSTGGSNADNAMQSVAALRSAAAGVPQDSNLQSVGLRESGRDGYIMPTAQALEVQAQPIGTMPFNRDGAMSWGDQIRSQGIGLDADVQLAPMAFVSENMVDARCPTGPLRVANDATFFWTGQSLGDQHLSAVPSSAYKTDATSEGDRYQRQTQMLYEQNARAHPSTYGTAAPFRNVYSQPNDRKGLVSLNPETVRTMASPARIVMEQAAALQLHMRDEANRNKHMTMYTTDTAYESDFANSDRE